MAPQAKLYTFEGSCWAQTPRLAVIEADFPTGEIEEIRINLAAGENFTEDYLKISKGAGTVPLLSVEGEEDVYNSTITSTRKILSLAPHPPKVSPSAPTTIIEAVHASNIDPNAIFLHSVNEAERKAKSEGMVAGFLQGRQDMLEKLSKEGKGSKEFLKEIEGKKGFNGGLLEIYKGSPSDEDLKKHFELASHLWANAGAFIRGPLTDGLKATEGPYLSGKNVGESDFHVIAYLGRIATCAGASQGSPDAIKKLEKATHGKPFDSVVEVYWKAWIERESFKKVEVN